MSDETFSIVAIVSILVSAVALWSSIRRRQLMRRVLRPLENAEQSSGSGPPTVDAAGSMDGSGYRKLVRPAPNAPDALARVVSELKTALGLLEEVYGIGLWSKSDDSSDNRRKRQGLRETDWAVSGALRALTELRSSQPDLPAALGALEEDLRALMKVLEPLPHTVTDTMGENWVLDSTIRNLSNEIEKLMARASDLAEEQPRQAAGHGSLQ